MNIFFVSDTHFSHTNMWEKFKLADMSPSRPFKSNEEMDELMIKNWNDRVKTSDHIYHLGDVTMARGRQTKYIDNIMTRLNGHKRICLGNHDQLVSGWYYQWFEKVKAINVLDNILFTHIPIHPQNLGKFKCCVHGHTHVNSIMLSPHHPDPRYLNVCVEKTNYSPISLEEVKSLIKAQQ